MCKYKYMYISDLGELHDRLPKKILKKKKLKIYI